MKKLIHLKVLFKGMTVRGWLMMSGVIALLLAVWCLTGCGTVKGILTGFEATSVGIFQDLRGAVDGIERANESVGGE